MGLRRYLKLDENFPNMGREPVTQVHEAQRVPIDITRDEHDEIHNNQINKNIEDRENIKSDK